MPFLSGLLAGLFAGLVVAAIVSALAYRRVHALRMKADQNQRLAELGTLTSGLAHEIKNPLSTIQLNLQLLLEDIRPEDPLHGRFANRISTVQREASRLKDILDDFLRYAGKMEVQRQETDLNSLLGDLVDFMSPQAQLHRVRLRLQAADKRIRADVDPRLVKQAVLNLMLNGMQAMGESGGDMILKLSEADGLATIHVIDTGKGMSQEVQEKMFQAYFTMRKGGTGLGLAMAKRIVDEHSGTISVRSEEGKGSDFRIDLPLSAPVKG